MEPPLLDARIELLKLSAKSFAEAPPSVGVPEKLVYELVISLPAPKIREPLELAVRLATPVMVLPIPE